MLDIKRLRENPEDIKRALQKRSIPPSVIDSILALDRQRRELLQDVESLQHEKNQQSSEIGSLAQKGEDISALRKQMNEISEKIAQGSEKIKDIQELLMKEMSLLPNIPDDSVPLGDSAAENVVLKTWGKPRTFSFDPLSHVELSEKNRWIDFDKGVKLAGNKFTLLMGKGAILSRKLQSLMLDSASARGYTEIIPPVLARREILFGSGQLPKFEDDLYKIEKEDSFLISTGEIPLVNMMSHEIIEENDLPLKLTAATSCFRREAGAAGKETRGLIRVHQFDKVELVQLTKPEASWDALEQILHDAEAILQWLQLPYRVVTLCTGDLTAFTSSKTYDIEVWFPSMHKYVEISSVSNCLDFQSRRANIRYRDTDRNLQFVHTLNGSGLAVGRCLAALIENRQQEDGSILVEDVLKS
ncbi:MAG: serine--tRNA ligase [Caldisericia bacterium]|nr:serine--tRNA ligase [Caldisericia bacterium]MDD4614662.1 serine--tRNA ligase [Caldisericia bacterium]